MDRTLTDHLPFFDCIGIGIGPSNLSLACLLAPLEQINVCFLEQRKSFSWHEGMLIPNACIQVPLFKDLVSLVDPRSQYSFLSFLHQKKRFYQFLNASFSAVRRTEFNQYLQWVSDQLSNLHFSRPVQSINFTEYFHINIQNHNQSYHANNIVLGVGLTPHIPSFAKHQLCKTIFHTNEFLDMYELMNHKRVTIIGGGQSGAEVFLDLIIRPETSSPISCCWVSKRISFLPIDETPFTNEFFTPSYNQHFNYLSYDKSLERLKEQKLMSNGISSDTIKSIYQSIYENNFLKNRPIDINLKPNRELIELKKISNGWRLVMINKDTDEVENHECDIVIFATGYYYKCPDFLEPIQHRLQMNDHELAVNDDFSVSWDGPPQNRIFVQNGAQLQRGIADVNLSLTAWRSAKIANSLVGSSIYDVDNDQSLINWCESISSKQREMIKL